MRVLILNDFDEMMENWYIGSDDCLTSNDIRNCLEQEFIIADNFYHFNAILQAMCRE